MADAFIVRRGGGGAGATLEITGVAGSTVYVANTTLGKSYNKVLDAQGKATFKGLANGTWDLYMTDGTKVTTGSIVITTEYSKSLFYYTFLYDGSKATEDERQCKSITGGWVYEGTPWEGRANTANIYTEEAGHIKATTTWNNSGAFRTANKLNLNDYSKIRIKGSTTGNNSTTGIQLAVWDATCANTIANTNFIVNSNFDITLDISSITSGTHYVGIRHVGGNSLTWTTLVTEIRLEP